MDVAHRQSRGTQADARDWDTGVSLAVDPDRDATETLRQALIKSNALFYRRERPFNDHSRHWTYIGGDFALYDQQLAELDKVIASLRHPAAHECKLVRKPVSNRRFLCKHRRSMDGSVAGS